ncbi:MAG: choice-of-anchor I family protein, partial [Crocosphaera sp.]
VSTANFNAFDGQEDTLRANGVRIFGLDIDHPNDPTKKASASRDFEPEYIAVSPDGDTAFVTLQENNAFAVVDIATAMVTDVLPLGFKDHSLPGNGLDASDRDGEINIQNLPVFGMYQPDTIASYKVGEETYYVTANEGDARVRPSDDDVLPEPNDEEGDVFNEEDRAKDLTLDPTAFPDAATLQTDEVLGRLNVTNTLGDTDGDGDFDELYAFGSRSFSIWNSDGQLVFDSGDDFEQITAALFPDIFNANRTGGFESRSDNKGPEPEGVTVGMIGDRFYAFIGLERIGGFMTYDVTDPLNPLFIKYVNDTALGDLSPEGLLFIPAEDSPNGDSLLVLTNEESGNTSIYSVTTPEPGSILGLMMLGIVGTLKAKFSGKNSKVKS